MSGNSKPTSLLQHVQAFLADQLPAGAPLCVALSGGIDSTVLLHLLNRQQDHPVRAVHIDHGLQADSLAWAEHCQRVCAELGVACEVVRVAVTPAGRGIEAAARESRYAALAASLQAGEVLLTGHHAQDQLETFLLQSLRGGGPRGIAAMPALTAAKGYLHGRPLLAAEPAMIRAYAEAEGLEWIDDPSNAQTDLDRNYLRHNVLPMLSKRWPAANQSVLRSARLNAEAAELLDELARLDAGDDGGDHSGDAVPRLDLARLRPLSRLRQGNLLRFVLRRYALPVPSEVQLSEALDSLLAERPDSQPLAAWPGCRIRRFQDELRFYTAAGDPEAAANSSTASYAWDTTQPLCMGGVRGTLQVSAVDEGGIAAHWFNEPVVVRFREGGEQLRPSDGSRTRDLKKLLQESQVVPWMRGHIPLVYAGSQLLAVGDIWVEAACRAAPGEPGSRFVWTEHEPLN